MKKLFAAFLQLLSQLSHDAMAVVCALTPILMGCVFRFALPVLETLLCGRLGVRQLLAPYYYLFDLLLAALTPMMLCFAGVLVMLEEADCGVARYLMVTPLGRSGYLASRLGTPAAVALVYNAALLCALGLSGLGAGTLALLCVGDSLMAAATSLLVVTLAKNKMEGMTLVKLCGLQLAGVPAACFMRGPARYAFGVLPSFWMAELCIAPSAACAVLVPAVPLALLACLYAAFRKRLL